MAALPSSVNRPIERQAFKGDLAGKSRGLSTLFSFPQSHTNIHMQKFAVNLLSTRVPRQYSAWRYSASLARHPKLFEVVVAQHLVAHCYSMGETASLDSGPYP